MVYGLFAAYAGAGGGREGEGVGERRGREGGEEEERYVSSVQSSTVDESQCSIFASNCSDANPGLKLNSQSKTMSMMPFDVFRSLF